MWGLPVLVMCFVFWLLDVFCCLVIAVAFGFPIDLMFLWILLVLVGLICWFALFWVVGVWRFCLVGCWFWLVIRGFSWLLFGLVLYLFNFCIGFGFWVLLCVWVRCFCVGLLVYFVFG